MKNLVYINACMRAGSRTRRIATPIVEKHRPCIIWRYKGQKRIQTMQYFFWAMYPFFKLIGMWNRMSEVAYAMIAVSRNGYHKAAIECRDISNLAKQ